MPYKRKHKVYAKYTPPPETEIKLNALQDIFLDPECDPEIKNRYFLTMKYYSRSLLLKEIKRKGIILPPEKVEELSIDATLLLMRQYDKEGWRIGASFAGALRWKVVEALYSSSKEEMTYSLNKSFTDDVNSKEVLDLMSAANTPWYKTISDDPADEVINQHNAAVDEIRTLIDQAYQLLPYRLYIRFLPWLLLRLRRPKTKNIMTTFSKLYLSSKEEEAFEILLLEMRNRIMMHAR